MLLVLKLEITQGVSQLQLNGMYFTTKTCKFSLKAVVFVSAASERCQDFRYARVTPSTAAAMPSRWPKFSDELLAVRSGAILVAEDVKCLQYFLLFTKGP